MQNENICSSSLTQFNRKYPASRVFFDLPRYVLLFLTYLGRSKKTLLAGLKGQSHQDLVLLENPVKVFLLIGNPIIIV